MADTNNKLPEGTDAVIEAGGTGGSGGGAGRSGTGDQGGSTSSATNSTGGRTSVTSSSSQTDALITGSTGDAGAIGGAGSTGSAGLTGGTGSTGGSAGSTGGAGSTGSSSSSDTGGSSGSDNSSGGVRGLVSNVTTKARDEAMGRARGFVGDGLKSGSATLGNVANIIEDTIEQIGERLGPQYADYARTASTTINRYATTLENKDPDELVDDARDLIRKSPGVALTGAAIIGFGLVRLLKVGMPQESSNGTSNRQDDRTGSTR